MVRCLGFLAKLSVFVIVMIISYEFVEGILQFADSLPALAGMTPNENSQSVLLFKDVLLLVSAVFVGVFFTTPILLSMFGHGGAMSLKLSQLEYLRC